MNFSFWFWPPFGSHFGGVLGAQMEAKAIKKPPQKNIKKNDAQNEPKLVPKGPPNGLSWRPHPLLRTAPTTWKPSRRSPEGLTWRTVLQNVQITPKILYITPKLHPKTCQKWSKSKQNQPPVLPGFLDVVFFPATSIRNSRVSGYMQDFLRNWSKIQ